MANAKRKYYRTVSRLKNLIGDRDLITHDEIWEMTPYMSPYNVLKNLVKDSYLSKTTLDGELLPWKTYRVTEKLRTFEPPVFVASCVKPIPSHRRSLKDLAEVAKKCIDSKNLLQLDRFMYLANYTRKSSLTTGLMRLTKADLLCQNNLKGYEPTDKLFKFLEEEGVS